MFGGGVQELSGASIDESDAVGAASVQLASCMGATVTGVCSGRNSELVRSLGAADVVDYQTQDMSRFEGRYDGVYGFYLGGSCVVGIEHEGTAIVEASWIWDEARVG